MDNKGLLDNVARQRIISWRQALDMTQVAFGEGIGRNPAWVSRWEKGRFNADLDTLAKMAAVVGQSLAAVLNLQQRADAKEREVLDTYNRIAPKRRALARQLLRELSGRRS